MPLTFTTSFRRPIGLLACSAMLAAWSVMVAAGAASEAPTVAIAVLAAGASLNLLLDKAVKKVQDLTK